MSIRVTNDLVEATYELLRMTRPFKGWRLPHSDSIVFSITRDRGTRGDFLVNEKGEFVIRINDKYHHTLPELIKTVAHEMCHLHEQMYGIRKDVHHGAWYNSCADKVCKAHGFDRGAF